MKKDKVTFGMAVAILALTTAGMRIKGNIVFDILTIATCLGVICKLKRKE